MSKKSSPFFLISFLPAVAYTILESCYPVRIAVIGGMTLSIIELVGEKLLTKKIHSISWMNMILVFVLGPLSLIASDGIWFKLQPSLSCFFFALFLGYKLITGMGLMQELVADTQRQVLPKGLLRQLEWHFFIFLLGYAGVMAITALFFKTSVWLFFKTAGFYIASILFIIFEFCLIRFIALAHRKSTLPKSESSDRLKLNNSKRF